VFPNFGEAARNKRNGGNFAGKKVTFVLETSNEKKHPTKQHPPLFVVCSAVR
jgi:hypothetical protein